MTDTSTIGTISAGGPEGVSLHIDETRSTPAPRRRNREEWPRRLRRIEVPGYVHDVHGVIIASASLAKLAVVGGGPEYELWGRIPYYPTSSLDQWVEARLSLRRSTSDRGEADRPPLPGAHQKRKGVAEPADQGRHPVQRGPAAQADRGVRKAEITAGKTGLRS